MVGLDIIGLLHAALESFGRFQTQGENHSLIALPPWKNRFKPKHQKVVRAIPCSFAADGFGRSATACYFNAIFNCKVHSLSPLFGLSYVAVQKAAPNQQQTNKIGDAVCHSIKLKNV
jgi:hypothetical protein